MHQLPTEKSIYCYAYFGRPLEDFPIRAQVLQRFRPLAILWKKKKKKKKKKNTNQIEGIK